MTGSCVLYLRTDTESDIELAMQEASLRKVAAEAGLIVAGVYSDNGKPGDCFKDRVGLLSAFTEVQMNRDVKAFMVQDMSRLSTWVPDIMETQVFLTLRNVTLIAPFDKSRPESDTPRTVFVDVSIGAFDQYWRQMIKKCGKNMLARMQQKTVA